MKIHWFRIFIYCLWNSNSIKRIQKVLIHQHDHHLVSNLLILLYSGYNFWWNVFKRYFLLHLCVIIVSVEIKCRLRKILANFLWMCLQNWRIHLQMIFEQNGFRIFKKIKPEFLPYVYLTSCRCPVFPYQLKYFVFILKSQEIMWICNYLQCIWSYRSFNNVCMICAISPRIIQ